MRSRRNVTSESPRRLWKARTLQGQRREGVTLRAVIARPKTKSGAVAGPDDGAHGL